MKKSKKTADSPSDSASGNVDSRNIGDADILARLILQVFFDI